MRGNDVIGILFAYVHEERVRELTQNRVMASVPYGGRYRLVDFPLSNMVNSGINKVGVITEQNYQSLMDHLGSGKAWDLSRKREGLYLLPPFGAETMRTEGKISSLASIMRFLKNSHEEYVLLSDCDTVANIDYKEVFALHTGHHHHLPPRHLSRYGQERGLHRGPRGLYPGYGSQARQRYRLQLWHGHVPHRPQAADGHD